MRFTRIDHVEKIMVSACLLGDKTRYDGKDNYFPFVEKLKRKYEIIPFCPEVSCGLPTPRAPAEIRKNQVVNSEGRNLTRQYEEAADHAAKICKYFGIRIAILKDKSPACGSRKIHDGSFSGNLIDGVGITARRLIREGIKVYAETDALDFLLPEEERKPAPRTKGYHATAPKKAASKKPAAKKPASKTVAKKPAAKKPASKSAAKPAAKKTYSSKPAAKKPTAKKPYAKKTSSNARNSYHQSRSYSKNKATRSTASRRPTTVKKSPASRKPITRKAPQK